MSSIELSGVCGDKDLETTFSPGPALAGISERGYYLWPEVSPGWFRAGSGTSHAGLDYLFCREARQIIGPFSGTGLAGSLIPRLHGPTLALWRPTTGGASDTNAISEASTEHPQRLGWKELVYAPCRERHFKALGTGTAYSYVGTSTVYRYTISPESDGWGNSGDPIPLLVADEDGPWKCLGSAQDLIACGTPGGKEWARTSGSVFVLRAQGQAAPSGLACSYIAGQTTLDWEEVGLSTSDGVPLSVPSLEEFTSVEIQYARGGAVPTGAVVSGSAFPRYAKLAGLPAGEMVVVRYKPSGVYGISSSGDTGGHAAARIPSNGVVCIRYEESSPEEKYSGGRPVAGRSVALSPLTSPPGFIVALAPGHPMHPTHPNPSLGAGYGTATSNSKILAWCSPSILQVTGAPGKVRALVLGPDGLPIPGVPVTFTPGANITVSPSTGTTNISGEAFCEVVRTDYGDTTGSISGDTSLTISIYSGASLVNQQVLSLRLGALISTSDFVSRLYSGRIHMALLKGRARSGRSRRLKLAIWRTSADGCPTVSSSRPITITCEEGRLFGASDTRAATYPFGGGGKTLTLTPYFDNRNPDWPDAPLLLEYEPSLTGEIDTIRASSQEFYEYNHDTELYDIFMPATFGSLRIDSNPY